MHLLNTWTKKLETFYGYKIPRYAILSHMWGGEEDEVLFRHIVGSDADKHEGEMRKGYAKVEGACRQAIEDGWKYIWIDTCCIDKTSSAELSEAINSMYEWYRNSGVCYVYLEDVQSDRELQVASGSGWKYDWRHDSDKAFPNVPFERSRWFKRGWTLQELIAPQFVVFYSKDWVDIGTKIGLRDTISAVTRIRVEVLTAYSPWMASVAEKMSWAAFRETTRDEDIAYCLMGLLGVNMPLLYGEGKRSFRRLQEELMKVSDDDSLFAWEGENKQGSNSCLYDTQGMLARSPREFYNGMNIVQSDDGAHSPYSMTNKGLKIKLPLQPIDPNLEGHIINIGSNSIFKTVLKCTVRESTLTRWIVIYLEKTGEGYYQRIFSHWLDKTEMLPSETGLTSLLVPQYDSITRLLDDAIMTTRQRHHGKIVINILPTESGFTADGHSLVRGYWCSSNKQSDRKVISFERQDKCFEVAVGCDTNITGLPWLDFIDVIGYGTCTSQGVEEFIWIDYLRRFQEGTGDWWVTVSMKRTGRYEWDPFLAVIDIQREPIRAKGWYIPPAIPSSNTLYGEFPFGYHDVHSDFKKESYDWIVVYNPKVEKKVDVSPMYTLKIKGPDIRCAQFSCDGKYLAINGYLEEIQIYDIEKSGEICTFIDEYSAEGSAVSICFSPNNKLLATGHDSGCIKIWDIDGECVLKVLEGHQERVRSLCFSPNGHLLISGSNDGTIRIWQIVDGTSRILTFSPKSGSNRPVSIVISPDGSLLAAGDLSGVIWIWDMMTTQLLEKVPKHGEYVDVAFTPDGTGLVIGSDSILKYWDVRVGGLVRTGVKNKFDDPSDYGASGALAKRVAKPAMTFTKYKDHRLVAVSHDGRWVISASKRLVFWDLDDGTPQFVLDSKDSSRFILATNLAGNVFATFDYKSRVLRVWRYDNIEPQDNPDPHAPA